jgi:hypothetical protein
MDVKASEAWTDTGLDLRSGDVLTIRAAGSLNLGQGKSAGPAGANRGFRDLIKSYPVNSAGLGALIGRIGSEDVATPFLVGANGRIQAARAGRLFLGINKSGNDSPEGSFHVKIEFSARGPETSAVPANLHLPEVTQAMIDRIPRRVVDAQGNPGDNTNFVVVGPEKKVLETFQAAGWVKVDRDRKDAVLSGVLATLSRQAYLTLPMSELELFGRVQDYGLAHAEPLSVVAQRHHLRLWKAPFKVEDEELWVGAATHDIGFDRDQRNNGVTHKIDPNIDDEREYVGKSLNATGLVARLSYLSPGDPSKEAKTATGATFYSDGRVLVIHLVPDNAGAAATADAGAPDQVFANLFCSVLEKENPDTGDWGNCAQYLETAPQARVDLAAIPNTHRVLVVPGFFSQCASNIAPAYQEGVEHLRSKHGLTVDWWVPPNASSEDNGAALAAYLRGQMKTDRRKFIVLGYSKGAPDVQTALALEPDAKDAVAAFLAVAGAVGGSPIASIIPAQADRFIDRLKLGKCEGDINAAFQSLRRDVRQAFLAAHPDPVVPSYSLPAVSDASTTSRALAETWRLLQVFGDREDGQLVRDDAILPGSKVLGTARADHLAVALPFDKAPDASVRSMVDKGRYPRAALLEAMVRLVLLDLAKTP